MNPLRQRLYLVTPTLDDTAAFAGELESVLGAADVAAVLLKLADSGERTLIERAKAVAAVVQRRDAALILDGRAEIVARAGADGAHLTGIQTFAAAVAMLKPDRIAGAGGLRSRHDAMLAGETGADYVMFGDPDRNGRRPDLDALQERLTWWTELFEIPCVAYAASKDEVEPLAKTGADFIALGEWIWRAPNGAADAVAAAAKLVEPAAP
ncbi:MAG TPA: thiamine phosphate synthase [Xanthobacteraceae bacterium]|nr:thiamine phosphate synthase [Xanthobacteraceae bacterium]